MLLGPHYLKLLPSHLPPMLDWQMSMQSGMLLAAEMTWHALFIFSIHTLLNCTHNIIKQCVFGHVGLESITMSCCPNLVQGKTRVGAFHGYFLRANMNKCTLINHVMHFHYRRREWEWKWMGPTLHDPYHPTFPSCPHVNIEWHFRSIPTWFYQITKGFPIIG